MLTHFERCLKVILTIEIYNFLVLWNSFFILRYKLSKYHCNLFCQAFWWIYTKYCSNGLFVFEDLHLKRKSYDTWYPIITAPLSTKYEKYLKYSNHHVIQYCVLPMAFIAYCCLEWIKYYTTIQKPLYYIKCLLGQLAKLPRTYFWVNVIRLTWWIILVVS